jgi:hypothetical protein
MSTNKQDVTDGPIFDDETWGYVMAAIPRILRACGYAVIAALLMSTISYEIASEWTILAVIGLLGLFTSSARIGQFGLLILLTMSLISPDVVQTFLR